MTVIGCGLLVFMAELSISSALYIHSSVSWAVLVPCSQREAFMSLCLAIPAFLVMLSDAHHLCNLPVGSPVTLYHFPGLGKGRVLLVQGNSTPAILLWDLKGVTVWV